MSRKIRHQPSLASLSPRQTTEKFTIHDYLTNLWPGEYHKSDCIRHVCVTRDWTDSWRFVYEWPERRGEKNGGERQKVKRHVTRPAASDVCVLHRDTSACIDWHMYSDWPLRRCYTVMRLVPALNHCEGTVYTDAFEKSILYDNWPDTLAYLDQMSDDDVVFNRFRSSD